MNLHKIIQLDKDIANKIAAGEVVERPLAVVKELVENAIDAGSDKIIVEVKDAGKSLIRITDNGRGIAPEDLNLAFERHATSKIRTINDIYNIASLGFRGEALASIASVSNVEIISKYEDHDFGKKLMLEGGKLVLEQEVGAPQGTTIFVKDLFFNTPARLKFLKSNQAEQNAINDIMNKLALSHPEISFKYMVGGHNIFMTPGNGKMYDVIVNIYEKNIWKHLIEVHEDNHGMKISGFISSTDLTRGNRQYQTFFVNNRFVKSVLAEEALHLAYRALIPHNRFAIGFLNINIDPSLIDINIHPSKTEIRFHQEGIVKDLIYQSISKVLNRVNLVPKKEATFKALPPLESHSEDLKSYDLQRSKEKIENNEKTLKINSSSQTTKGDFYKKEEISKEKLKIYQDTMTNLHEPFKEEVLEKSIEKNSSAAMAFKKEPTFVERVYESPKPLFEKETETIYDDLVYIGQIFNTYLIFQKKDMMYLLDQHAAHEKVLFERYVHDFKKNQVSAQMILEPITIDMNYQQYSQVNHHLKAFEKLGFYLEAFGEKTMVVREIPNIFSIKTAEAMIYDLIEKLDYKLPDENFELVLEDLMQQSCKHAIKGHDVLRTIEVKSLIKQLKVLKEPYTCPHGRPIIIAMTQKELEKKFNRT
jgi:DNA mismatch repair protein MutL